ncbi:DNA-processing protein DprA [Ruminococcus albus]|uniref:DNA protecting protein DprA n=1 Tax=Ruminococcus albus (strain ATCC 27210 / DSM 20455 / JCM 14654 / NCDO 2250 / 7) TaxID=697329 RepID=E6UIA1_RUMA7|nr:DNA-processing protein DprA [Ruminococcus albus]ADU22162.1 DNA protecting protein DprA [Ruminococcus albus 7 = DSM 20455]
MSMTDKQALFTLSLIYTPGKAGIDSLMQKYNDPAKLMDTLQNQTDKDIPHSFSAAAKAFDYTLPEQIQSYCGERGIEIITRYDEDFPDELLEVDCPPMALYCLGDKKLLKERTSLTIVGSREATPYSIDVAKYFARTKARDGHTIISGFARGIDTAAHTGAIEAEGKTIAVLGCGIDYDYPRYSGDLKNSIVQNGAVISEYPPLEKPDREYFTIRNRMIAGLSKAVLVVQAGVHSGSINTASHAISQGKDVYCIPPANIFNDIYKGQSVLLRDGAIPAFEPHDIVL